MEEDKEEQAADEEEEDDDPDRTDSKANGEDDMEHGNESEEEWGREGAYEEKTPIIT